MSQRCHHINVVSTVASCLVNINGVSAWERWNVSLIIGITKYIEVVNFNYLEVVLDIPSVFQGVEKGEEHFQCDLTIGACLMLRPLPFNPKLVGDLLEATIERVSVQETFNIEQVGEE